jgi:prepilin-type N-terminal cleavage/methylation domain-containing protein
MTHTSMNVRRTADAAGYTLVELLISMGIMSLVMAATMTTVSNAVKANDTVLQMSGISSPETCCRSDRDCRSRT